MRKKGKTGYYDVDQSNLISRIKEDFFEIISNINRENVRIFTKDFIKKCIHTPNKVKEPKKNMKERKNYSNQNTQQDTNQHSKKNQSENIKSKIRRKNHEKLLT